MADRDDDDDELETHRLPVTEWLAPVHSADQLPDVGVNDGTLCYVQAVDDEAVWQFRRGSGWVRVGKTPRGR